MARPAVLALDGTRPAPRLHPWIAAATPLVFGRVTLWSFLALLVTTTMADADLWGHLRFGLDVLAAKTLHTIDPYSFTSDRAWINHEWLAELLMGGAYRLLGPLGLGLLKLGLITIVAATLFAVAREEEARSLARDVFVAVAVFATYSRTQVVRPQLFSVAIFAVVLYLLRCAARGERRWLWGLPFCFALWANVHGAWIVGLGAVGVWMAGDIVHVLRASPRRAPRPVVICFVIGALCLLATLLTPYGVGLWQFMAETVRPARPDVTDWKPLLALPAPILVIESILPLLALAAAWRARGAWRLPLRDLAVIALLTVATIRVGRVDAFLQAAIAFFLAAPLVQLFTQLERRARPSFRRASLPVGVLTVTLAGYVSWMAIDNLRVVRVQGRWIPDREAALALRDARPGARVLTWFDWGEYALWHLSPAGIRVSMDGRRETVYRERTIADHMRFYAGDADMADYPDRIGADHIWLPIHFPILEALRARGWKTVLDTGKSVVLSRNAAPIHHAPAVTVPPHFPW